MSIDEYIKQYGTSTASLMLRRVASTIEGLEEAKIIREVADNLESALLDYIIEANKRVVL